MANLGEFKPQELSNFAWAYSKLSIHDTPLREAIASQAMTRMSAFQYQELSNLAWAFAKSRIDNEPLFESIASAAIKRGSGAP